MKAVWRPIMTRMACPSVGNLYQQPLIQSRTGLRRTLTSAVMPLTLNINQALKKEHEVKKLSDLVNQDVTLLQGIGPVHLEALHKLGLFTISDLANYKYYHRARSIVNLMDAEEVGKRSNEATMNLNKLLKKEYEGQTLKELAEAPAVALQGLSPETASLLESRFHVSNISDLAALNYCRWAEAMVTLAPLEE